MTKPYIMSRCFEVPTVEAMFLNYRGMPRLSVATTHLVASQDVLKHILASYLLHLDDMHVNVFTYLYTCPYKILIHANHRTCENVQKHLLLKLLLQ